VTSVHQHWSEMGRIILVLAAVAMSARGVNWVLLMAKLPQNSTDAYAKHNIDMNLDVGCFMPKVSRWEYR